MTADLTPTRTSYDRSHVRATRSRGVSLLLSGLVAALGLLWLSTVYADNREGAWVEGTFVFDEAAWGVDFDTDLVAAEFELGAAGLYYYAPPLSSALIPLADLPIADSSSLWWVLRILGLLAACALMPVSWPVRGAAFAVVAEVGYMVVICGSLLHLASLVVPAAFLATRLWPPLVRLSPASWLQIVSPVIVRVTMLLLLACEKRPQTVPAATGAAA